MSEQKNTPAPWLIEESNAEIEMFFEHGYISCGPALVANEPSKISDQMRADARLISKAPEMLAMLQHIMKSVPTVLIREGLYTEIEDLVDDASGVYP